MQSRLLLCMLWLLMSHVTAEGEHCAAQNNDALYGKCNFRSKCYGCLQTNGCAFDTTTGVCTMTPGLNVTVNYCASDDVDCRQCLFPGRALNCRGENGCLCPRQCEFLSTLESDCADAMPKSMVGVRFVAVLTGVLIGIIVIRLRCIHQRDQSLRSHRTIRPDHHHHDQHKSLTLAAWRQHVTHQADLQLIIHQHEAKAAHTIEATQEQEAYAPVTTPRSRA